MTSPEALAPGVSAEPLAIGAGGVGQVLELARRHLDMEVALLSEFTEGQQVLRQVAGGGDHFGYQPGRAAPLADTYCHAMTLGHIPNAICDAAAHPVTAALPATGRAGIRSYVGVPIRLADGALYGSLCVLSRRPRQVDSRDVRFLALLADLVAQRIGPDLAQVATRRRLAALLADESVDIAAQPIVDIATGRVIGVEALSRFPAEWGAPDRVFAAAHRAGVGVELERLALRQALKLLPLLRAEQYLAVNLSPAVAIELGRRSPNFPQVAYSRLVLEITEHASIENYAILRDNLAWARNQGLRLSIDDAGAGFASLHHIVELGPDIIKIDRSLIDGIADSAALRSVASAFVRLAADLDATVIAEGVERPVDLDAVRALGVDAAQGYLLARPSTDRVELATWVSDGFPPLLPAAC